MSVPVRARTEKDKLTRVFLETDAVQKLCSVVPNPDDALHPNVEVDVVAKITKVWSGATGISIIFKATDILVHKNMEEEGNPFSGYSLASNVPTSVPTSVPAPSVPTSAPATSGSVYGSSAGAAYDAAYHVPAYGELPPDFE